VIGAHARRLAVRGTRARWLLVLSLALPVACATLPPSAGSLSYSGRFSVQVTGDDRHDNLSGRFALTVDRAEVTLDLSTPLGTTMARIQSRADGARLTVPYRNGVRTESGPDPEGLSQRVLGWALPVSGIRDWIEGRPAPGRPYQISADEGGGSLLEQDGWTIRLDPRGPDGRIRRLQLDHPQDGDAPAVSLRVVLDPGAQG